MSPPFAKTSCRQLSPASQAITRASIAEKSATTNLQPPGGDKGSADKLGKRIRYAAVSQLQHKGVTAFCIAAGKVKAAKVRPRQVLHLNEPSRPASRAVRAVKLNETSRPAVGAYSVFHCGVFCY